jgi:thiol-disulfide isomerase/thioredoxin
MVVILIVGLFAILLVWALRPAKPNGEGVSHPSVGRVMENFRLIPLVGDATPVTSESLHGEVTLMNFWGTWCGPCMMEFPHLVELNDRLKSDKGFRFVPVSCGPGGSDLENDQLQLATEAYLAKFDTELISYSDPRGTARMSLMKAAQLPGFAFPTTVLLDREGKIRGLWQGYRPGVEAEMEQAIKALLKS